MNLDEADLGLLDGGVTLPVGAKWRVVEAPQGQQVMLERRAGAVERQLRLLTGLGLSAALGLGEGRFEGFLHLVNSGKALEALGDAAVRPQHEGP